VKTNGCARALLALLALTAPCSAQEWIPLAKSTGAKNIWEAHAGSFQKTDAGASLLTRERRSDSPRIVFRREYVSLSDCQAGHGQLITSDPDGKNSFSTAFVLEGESIAASIAGRLCRLRAR
jgi:hypothetical protein